MRPIVLANKQTSVGLFMRLAKITALSIGSLLLIPALQAADDACSLLSQARVSELLGVKVGPGEHASETPIGRRTCSWSQPSPGVKQLLLDVFGTIGRLTPVERFQNAKRPITGITKTPVSGIGDDAFLMVSGAGFNLYVKKGDSVIQIKVNGFPQEDAVRIEKILAGEAISKL